MRSVRLVLCLASVWGVWAGVCAGQSTLLRNVTLIDVEAGAARPGMSVLIEGDRIARIAPASGLRAPAGGAVVEGDGLFLIPGLFDAHVHYVAGEDVFGPLLVAHGVTAARDTGGPTEQVVRLRAQSRGAAVMPELFVTGAIIDGDPPVWPFSEACGTPDAARDAVRRLAEAGVDQIKVYARLEKDVYLAAVDEARRRGLTVTGHVPASTALMDAARAGHGCVEHFEGFGPLLLEMLDAQGERPAGRFAAYAAWAEIERMDRDALRGVLRELGERGVMQCPTLIVNRSIGSIADGSGKADERMRHVPAHMRSFWGGPQYEQYAPFAGRLVGPMQVLLGEAHRAGVPLMIGTDLANPYVFAGSGVHDEMALFQGAGIPAPDVLRMATIVPAEFLGAGDRLGSIAQGKAASMVLVRANPLEDVAHVRQVEGVFLRGRHYDRDALDAMLAGVERYVAQADAPDAGPAEIDLPGEVVARGRYRLKFDQWDAGVEDFVITRSDAGYHVFAHTQPMGGGQTPSKATLHLSDGLVLRSARFEQPAADGAVIAEYTVENGVYTATARQGERELEAMRLDLAGPHALIAPGYVSFMATVGALGLDVDQAVELPAVVFGYPDWRLTQAPGFRVERLADEAFDGGGAMARRHNATLDSEMGALHYETLTDERGVLLRFTLRLPMGTLRAELE